jgi:hypothetical protein
MASERSRILRQCLSVPPESSLAKSAEAIPALSSAISQRIAARSSMCGSCSRRGDSCSLCSRQDVSLENGVRPGTASSQSLRAGKDPVTWPGVAGFDHARSSQPKQAPPTFRRDAASRVVLRPSRQRTAPTRMSPSSKLTIPTGERTTLLVEDRYQCRISSKTATNAE